MARIIILTKNRLIDGILAFGMAHIAYIYAYYRLYHGEYNWVLVFIVTMILLIVYFFIGFDKELPKLLLVASFFYALLLISLFISVLMLVLYSDFPVLFSIIVFPGVILFMFSDSILAYNEYKGKIPHASEIIGVSYVISQILLQMTPIVI